MIKKTMLYLALTYSVTSAAYANACAGKTVFQCKTKRQKVIQVCKTNSDYIYSYGKSGKKPELMISAGHNNVVKTPWNGMGLEMFQSIEFTNGKARYAVFSNYNRAPNSTNTPIGGGVIVTMGDKEIIVECLPNTIKDDIESEVN